MKNLSLWLVVIVVLALSGCEYILTEPAANCEPPNKIVKDIYGNEVCVTPESNEFSLPEEEPKNVSSENMSKPPVMPPKVEEKEEETVSETEGESQVSGLPRKEVTEGDLVEFPNLAATDPDGDNISYTFEAPLDETGKWQTEEGDAGEYVTTITASDGVNKVSQDIIVVVLQSNHPPVISGIKDLIVVEEGDTITLDPVVSDEDGDEVTVFYSGFMDSTRYKTGFDDAGEYKETITATDGITETKLLIDIVVMDVNRPPVIETIDDIQTKIGEEVVITPQAVDPDDDKVEFTFSQPFDKDGKWIPKEGDSGEYDITVTASDGKDQDIEKFKLVVGTPNLPPVLEPIDDIVVEEGDTIEIKPMASDPEGEDVVYSISGWLTKFFYKTNFEDAGDYNVEVSASDGENVVTQEVKIQVLDKNRPPQWDPGAFN